MNIIGDSIYPLDIILLGCTVVNQQREEQAGNETMTEIGIFRENTKHPLEKQCVSYWEILTYLLGEGWQACFFTKLFLGEKKWGTGSSLSGKDIDIARASSRAVELRQGPCRMGLTQRCSPKVSEWWRGKPQAYSGVNSSSWFAVYVGVNEQYICGEKAVLSHFNYWSQAPEQNVLQVLWVLWCWHGWTRRSCHSLGSSQWVQQPQGSTWGEEKRR